MSDNRRSESVVLNWRGPLLAAGIFAVGFAVLLLMAHQNQSKTSDMGSSLRDDPYGTSLLFNSYGRAGYQVKRSQDEDSLADQDASRTTAFFVGGYSAEDFRMERGKAKVGERFRRRLEGFLARGGRVVLIAPAKLKSESQGWEVDTEWKKTAAKVFRPASASPTSAMPAGTEKLYLGADAPWLKTDGTWKALYTGSVAEDADATPQERVYVAMRSVENGELIAASQESFLLNEAIKRQPNPVLLDYLAGGRPVVWVDETLHGMQQDHGVLWLVQRYRLQAALLLFWTTLLAVLWSMSGDLVRRPSVQNEEIIRYSDGTGVAARRLLQRSIAREQVVAECWEQFRRRSPQDADAIAGDTESGPRLRAALAQPPLAGYRHLGQLIAERRASARGFAQASRDRSDSCQSSQKASSKE